MTPDHDGSAPIPHITPRDPVAFGAMLAAMLGGGAVTVDPATRQITIVPDWVAEEAAAEAAAAAAAADTAPVPKATRARARRRR